jgi:hypothetical protein
LFPSVFFARRFEVLPKLADWIAGQKLPVACKGKGIVLRKERKLTASEEILLWMTPSEAPKALQASECSELLDPKVLPQLLAPCWPGVL